MNILEFINSEAIREHCRVIKHHFDALECAYLIWQSVHHSLEEKHLAYQELINTMPDMPVKIHGKSKKLPSLHAFLQEYISIEKQLLSHFYQKEENTIYLYSVCVEKNTDCLINDRNFMDFKSCLEDALRIKSFVCADIIRQSVYDKVGKGSKKITVTYSPDKKPYWVRSYGFLDERQEEIFDIFSNVWIEVPTPFQEGDIVYCAYPTYDFYFDSHPLVLKKNYSISENEKIVNKLKYIECEFMLAEGYYQKLDGQVFSGYVYNYLGLEYYPHGLTGKERFLKTLQRFIKGELDIEQLLDAYTIILCEEHAAKKIQHKVADALSVEGEFEMEGESDEKADESFCL